MLDEIKDLQNEAVSQLFYLFEKEDKKELIFKAPTGSGKTFMMADFCNRVLEKRNDIVFLISSLSKGDLAEQNYEKFVEYNKEKLDLYLIRTETTTEQALNIEKDHKDSKIIIPGFYGSDKQGNIVTFSRGGSDITGALVARAMEVTVYENWTDVSGVMFEDPRLVKDAKKVS